MVEPVFVAVLRGGRLESLHRGSVAVCDAEGRLVAGAGDPGTVTFWRSSLKPIQAMALAESGALEAFKLGEEALALACASHDGTERHVAVAEAMLKAAGLSAKDLQCGVHVPSCLESRSGGLHLGAYEGALAKGSRFDARHNNCSGKHAGMLVASKHRGYPTATYLEPSHSHQKRIREILAAMSSEAPPEPAVDGCSAPIYAMSLKGMATAYARLARPPSGLEKVARRVTAAMSAHPDLVHGEGRFDTELMRAAAGKIVAKRGAEGLACLCLTDKGWGVALKVTDGALRASPVAAMEVLRQIEALDAKALEAMRSFARPEVRNVKGKVVGEMRPGDFELERG